MSGGESPGERRFPLAWVGDLAGLAGAFCFAGLGALAGLFFGLPGLLVGPFVGSVLGELTVRGDLRAAGRVGLAAWIGFLVGNVVKLAIVFAVVGIATAAFFF